MHRAPRMRFPFLLPLAIAALPLFAASAAAHGGAVYSMTNDAQQNAVAMFERAEDGTLSAPTFFNTGGRGTGENLDSASGLVLTSNERWLLVVNAGSNSISSFEVREHELELVDTVFTGGLRPVSLDVHDRLVAVLNAGGEAGGRDSVKLLFLGSRGHFGRIPQSARALSADSTGPAQIAFAQSGHVLVVTEKRTDLIDTFRLRPNGRIGRVQVNRSNGSRPFGLARGERDQIFVSEADAGTVTSYKVHADGSLKVLDASVATNQTTTNWVVTTPGSHFAYATNGGSASLTAFNVDFAGKLALLDPTGVSGTTGPGPIDAAVSDDGHFLYALGAGDGSISGFHVQEDGTLAPVGSANGLPSGANGLAAR